MIDAVADSMDGIMVEGKKIAIQFGKKVAHPKVNGKVYQFLKLEMYDALYKLLLNDKLGYVPEFVAMSKKAKL